MTLTVMISGGFAQAYAALLPEFERTTGLKVTTLSGASQGTGPTTMKAQIAAGARPDVLILSREGLEELEAEGLVEAGSDVGLARSPLGAAVRAGAARPDLGTLDAFRDALVRARLVVMPGSTSGLHIRDVVLPQLGLAGKVRVKLLGRGTESTAALAAGEADLALGPVSELVGQPGVDYVAPLPDEVQLVQEFTAAILRGSPHGEAARRLIGFLSSAEATDAILKVGMEPSGR